MFRGDFMRTFKKMAALLLALSLTAGLAACGAASPGQELPAPEEPDAVETAETVGEGLVSTLVVKQEELPGGLAELSAMNLAGEELILAGRDAAGAPGLGTLDADGGFSALALPDDVVSVDAVCSTGEAVAALASTETGMCILSFGGGQDPRTELDADDASMLYGDLALAVLDGNFYVLYYMGIAEFGPDGMVSRICNGPEKWSYFTSMQEAGGRIYVAMGDGMNGGSVLCELDTSDLSLESVDIGEAEIDGLGLDAGGGLLLGLSTGGRDIAASLGADGPEELFDWSEPGIVSASFKRFWRLSGGDYAFFSYGDKALNLLREELAAPRTELTLLTDYPRSELYAMVNAFNLANPDYKVSVDTLGEDGLTMELLQTQLIAGQGPDIFAFYTYDTLTRLGPSAAVDLLGYLDADGEYSRESIVPGLLKAMSTDGALYALPYDFSITTFTAPSSAIPEPGITYAEAEAAAAEAGVPLFPPWMTQETLWGWLSEFAAVQFTDLEAGTCSFDSENYIALLEKCAATDTELPADPNQAYNGLLQFETLQRFVRLAAVSENYGGDYTFAGVPNDGSNGSMFSLDLSFAISAQSEHADGAWQFIRSTLSPEMQGLATMLPASQAELERQLDTMVETGMDFYGQWLQLTEADAEKFRVLLDGTTTVQGSLPTVTDILCDDAAQCFAGQISAEQAAAYSQERVSTWLAEQG